MKDEISALSQNKASDVDDWISQAKQLHEDIERSKLTAREIVKNYEKAQAIQSQVDDTAAKVGLLKRETAFTQSLRETLEKARAIDNHIETVQTYGNDNDLGTAVQRLEDVNLDLDQLALPQDSSIIIILKDKASGARSSLCATSQSLWNDLVCIKKEGILTIKSDGTVALLYKYIDSFLTFYRFTTVRPAFELALRSWDFGTYSHIFPGRTTESNFAACLVPSEGGAI